MTTRTWSCMCGEFVGKVTGEPVNGTHCLLCRLRRRAACWCHCGLCRKATGAAMQLGIFMDFEILQGGESLINYEHYKGSGVIRHNCSKCGSFCYKTLGKGPKAVPAGTLDPIVKPVCHIFVAHRGNQPIMFPELPQYDEFAK